MHFTPTSSSWLNVIELWFKELTDEQLRRGVFRSVAELIKTIEQFVAHHNAEPKGFVWTRKAEDILTKAALGGVESFEKELLDGMHQSLERIKAAAEGR